MNIISTLFASSIYLFFLTLISLPSPSLSAKCNPQDKKVLKQFEKAVTIPPHFQSWTPNTSCCDWGGVECDPQTGRVISLTIIAESVVSGRIPNALGDLSALQSLYIHWCPNLTGPLPKSLTKLTNLRILSLPWNSLSGSVPSFLSQLKDLNYIDLYSNKFSGPIPASLSQLPKLEYLRLQRNKLTGSIPDSLGKLALPSYIVIGENQLTGKVPRSFGNAENQLTGKVPRSFGNANFTSLDFSNNKLQGDISFLFGKKKTFGYGDFSNNLFEFDISKIQFSENLKYLDLNHNKVYGSLPVGLTKLEFQHFNVSYNRLCGKIPSGGKLQDYDITAYFHNRCLCGAPLPACK